MLPLDVLAAAAAIHTAPAVVTERPPNPHPSDPPTEHRPEAGASKAARRAAWPRHPSGTQGRPTTAAHPSAQAAPAPQPQPHPLP